jgi:hypothetical protein
MKIIDPSHTRHWRAILFFLATLILYVALTTHLDESNPTSRLVMHAVTTLCVVAFVHLLDRLSYKRRAKTLRRLAATLLWRRTVIDSFGRYSNENSIPDTRNIDRHSSSSFLTNPSTGTVKKWKRTPSSLIFCF